MILYQDEEGTKSFVLEDFGNVEPGQTAKKTGYLSNNSDSDIISIHFHAKDPDVSIIGLPDSLPADAMEKVSVVYSPPQTRMTPLKTSPVIIKGKKKETVEISTLFNMVALR